MRIYLAGIEWLTQPPAGNRLRWWYPSDDVSGGSYRGFPEAIVVERAPLDEDIPSLEGGTGLAFPVTGTIPFNWWDSVGTVSLAAIDMPAVHPLAPSVQALRFTYRGPTTRVLLRDRTRDLTLFDAVVADGEQIRFEAADIDEIVVYSYSAQLEDLATVDLFAPRELAWEEIAIVGVAPTVGADLGTVLARHGGASTLTSSEWIELAEMGQRAQASTPADAVAGEPTRWESFNLTLALRWELAALFGMGYFDGPHADVSPLDEIDTGAELTGVDPVPLAYRVRDRDANVGPSNIVVCPPWHAPSLSAPSAPQYIDPQVRLNPDDTFEATVEMQWVHNDPRALGAEIEEEIGASPSINSVATTETFEHRSRLPDDPPGVGRLSRVLDVPFHDVTLTSRACAVDAWDRVSSPSPWSVVTSLDLHHEPVPPGLLPGAMTGSTVRIPRQPADAFVADWSPDLIVLVAAGRVQVSRQIAQPRVETGVATAPSFVTSDRYEAQIAGVTNLADFAGGYLNANGTKYVIAEVVGNRVRFDAPGAGGSGVTLFPAGSVSLQQDDKDVSLWTPVADFPAVGLPSELVFTDTVAGPTGGADVLSYVARVTYLGRVGPASNVSQVIRIAPTPNVPPPFTVELLGVDFYDRTMVKIRFTNPVTSGRFTVWWADGLRNSAQFADHAVPGEYGAQATHEQRYVFDVLSIPVPRNQDRTITVGVQGVDDGGGQSTFVVVPVTIPAT